ncbi:MAG: DUF2802 domain-containing protein [Rhodocyclaceae bacterium]|nr:DUF2802 domain-containing protein [Rhodocyclaceae bacterium]
MLLRFWQVGRRPARSEPASTLEPESDTAADASPTFASPAAGHSIPPEPTIEVTAGSSRLSSAPAFEWEEVKDLFGETTKPATAAPSPEQPLAKPPSGFGEHLAEHLARAEIEMEVQRMRAEMERMRAEMDELRLARRFSPQYAEAMELAQRGLSAQAVADRLGISLAEAELVHALSRGDKNFAEGDDHGADEYAPNDGPNQFDNRGPGRG